MKRISKVLSCLLAAVIALSPVSGMTVNAAPTTSISVNTNELTEVENLVGHYQFNVAAGSNVNSKGDRGYSHVDSMKTYEKNHSSKLLGNSSGGYLDGSKNEGGSIYKAYLVIETSTVDFSLPDYPITFVSGATNAKLESKVEYYCFDTTYSSGNERRAGYLDVTEFVKKNGYGWYYVCNIPYSTEGASWNSDQFAGWKLIVIEENYEVPMRMLKLKIGSQNIMGAQQTSSIYVYGEGIRTARINDVTGQFLFGMAGADPGPVQANSIRYACGDSTDKTQLSFKSFKTVNNVRTEGNPLTFISSRNGVPLSEESQFENPVYFNPETCEYSTVNTNGTFMAGAGDLELLDITTTSDYYHDVKLDKNKAMVGFQFETVTDCALMATVMGIAVDIDVPAYDHTCNINYNDETGEIIVEGELKNITDLFDVGISTPVFVFEYDANLNPSSYEARLTSLVEDDSAKYEKILNKNEISLDRNNKKIVFQIQGIEKGQKQSKINRKNDTLYYKIVFMVDKVQDYYDNATYINGTLVSSGTDTGLYLDKIAAKAMRNSLTGVVTKRSLSGKIIWNDDSDEKHYRPQKIKVSLCMDSVAIDTIEVTGKGNIWEYSFDDLNIYKTLDYQYEYDAEIKEEYDHYSVSYADGSNDITFNLEQKHVPKNEVPGKVTEILNKAVVDMTPFGLDLKAISKAYGAEKKLNDDYTNKIIGE